MNLGRPCKSAYPADACRWSEESTSLRATSLPSDGLWIVTARSASRLDNENAREIGTSWIVSEGSFAFRRPMRGQRKSAPKPVRRRNANRSAHIYIRASQVSLSTKDLRLQLFGCGEEPLPGWSQQASGSHSVEEARIQRPVQGADPSGDCRRVNSHSGRGLLARRSESNGYHPSPCVMIRDLLPRGKVETEPIS